MRDAEKQKYIMDEIKKILDRPKPVDPEHAKAQARRLKNQEERRKKHEGSINDVMPDWLAKRYDREKQQKGDKPIPPPEEL